MLRPFRWVESVTSISLDELKAQGIRAIIIDLDNTLVGYKHKEPVAEVAAWVRHAQELGLAVAIVSNNVRAWVSSIAEQMGIVTYVHNALKPLPFGVIKAVKQLRVARSEVVVVGDQMFADVLAAKLLGINAILTDPIERSEHRAMWLVRALERFMLLGTKRHVPPSSELDPNQPHSD
jgi:uncharacterized protein